MDSENQELKTIESKPEKKSNQFGTKASGLAFLLCFVFSLVFSIIAQALFIRTNSFYVKMVAYTILQLMFVAVIAVVCLVNKTNPLKEYNFKKTAHWSTYLMYSVLAIILIFCFNYFINIFSYLISKGGFVSTALDLSAKTVGELIVSVIAIALIPAILEELVFRGIILKGSLQYGVIPAIVISTACFVLFHGSIEQTIFQAVLGTVCAIAYVSTGDIKVNTTIHFVNNAFILIYSYFVKGSGTLSFSALDIVISVILMLVGIGLIWLVTFGVKKVNKEQKIQFIKEDKHYNVFLIVAFFLVTLNWVYNTLAGFGIKIM